MKKKYQPPFLAKLLQKIAPRIGARVFIEPKWGIVSQIVFKNGKKRYTRFNCLDINTLGASEISNDKGYASFFMKNLGYPVIKGETFYSDSWAKTIGSKDDIYKGYKYAVSIGFPVIVKPNSGSQGRGVAKVYNKTQFYKAMRMIFKKDKIAIVQEYIQGNDYRIVVLDDKVISAYKRTPLYIVGDGVSSVDSLLTKKKKYFNKIKRDIKVDNKDPRIIEKLKTQGYKSSSIIEKNKIVFLLDNANLSTGGDSLDVTNEMHKDFKKVSINIAKDMGLRLCGVDLMIIGDIKDKLQKYYILETNAAPGLDHYVTTGKKQEKIVEDLYLEVLKSMEK